MKHLFSILGPLLMATPTSEHVDLYRLGTPLHFSYMFLDQLGEECSLASRYTLSVSSWLQLCHQLARYGEAM